MEYLNRFCKFLIGIIILLILVILMILAPLSVSAAEVDNSIVLDELRKTNSFDETAEEWTTPLVKYNEKENKDIVYNYAFKLVSIGFDDKRNLYVYTCQPDYEKKELTATSINILYETKDEFDVSETSNSSIKNYDLELISRGGKFDKYFVVGFNDYTHSSEDLERYISFISIYRKFDETIDKGLEVGYTNEVAFPIAEKWQVKEMGGYISYEKITINYVEVTPTVASRGYFKSGFSFKKLWGYTDACDLWFFAFNVDNYVVDHIVDASLIYDMNFVKENDVIYSFDGGNTTPTGIKDGIVEETEVCRKKELYISDTQEGSYVPQGWFDRKSFTWDRICKPIELVSVANEYHGSFVEESKVDILTSSQWVFNYLETSNLRTQHAESVMGQAMHTFDTVERYNVFNVSVFRIKFVDNRGKVHNLGVVCDKFTSEEDYFFKVDADVDNWARFGPMIGLILLVVLLILLFTLCPPLFIIFKVIVKAILLVILLPFKIIKWVFKRK